MGGFDYSALKSYSVYLSIANAYLAGYFGKVKIESKITRKFIFIQVNESLSVEGIYNFVDCLK